MAAAEVGQDSSEHVNELEEQALVHVDPDVEPYTHLAPDENMYAKVDALAVFQPPMLWLKAVAE